MRLLSNTLSRFFLLRLSSFFPPGKHCVARDFAPLLRCKLRSSNFPTFGTAQSPQCNSVRVLLFGHLS